MRGKERVKGEGVKGKEGERERKVFFHLCFEDCSGRQLHSGEGVHGAPHPPTADPGDTVEPPEYEVCLALQPHLSKLPLLHTHTHTWPNHHEDDDGGKRHTHSHFHNRSLTNLLTQTHRDVQ